MESWLNCCIVQHDAYYGAHCGKSDEFGKQEKDVAIKAVNQRIAKVVFYGI